VPPGTPPGETTVPQEIKRGVTTPKAKANEPKPSAIEEFIMMTQNVFDSVNKRMSKSVNNRSSALKQLKEMLEKMTKYAATQNQVSRPLLNGDGHIHPT
jgi:hypothetical protein